MTLTKPVIEVDSESCHPSVGNTAVRKKLVRKPRRDWSQPIRRVLQGGFIALNLYVGVQFYMFVHRFEHPGASVAVSRPAGVEGWLPIAGMMNLKYFLVTGRVPQVHPAAMVLFATFLLISVLFRKSFCSWLCPVGTLSEALWKLGRRFFRKNWALPRWVDIPLRGLKYLLLLFFVYAVMGLSAAGIDAFLSSPYGVIADVKMLNFFRFLSTTASITLVSLALLSIIVKNFWCRYLCPYGALMGLASLISPVKISRDQERCIDCAKCARVCPALLPVDKLTYVRSAECTTCLECIAVCPSAGALDLSLPARRRVPAGWMAAGIALLFFGIVGYAKLRGAWESRIPDSIYRQYVPAANDFQHP